MASKKPTTKPQNHAEVFETPDTTSHIEITAAPATQTASTPEQAHLQQSAAFLEQTAARRKAEGESGEMARFGKALDRQQATEQKERATKEEMLGADPSPFTRIRDYDDAEITFYPKPPKIGALPDLMHELSMKALDVHTQVDLTFALATTYLYVKDEQTGLKRRSTVDEIATCLNYDDMDMLVERANRYLGVTMDKLTSPKS